MSHFEIAYKRYDVAFEIHDIDYADKSSLNHYKFVVRFIV